MATYTVRMNEWVDFLSEEIREEHPDKRLKYYEIVNLAAQKIIDFPYVCYGLTIDEQNTFREELNRRIINHYIMREIGYETPELWKLMLKERLDFIMPRYQELYKSTLFELDFDDPYHMITEHNETQRDDRNIEREGKRNNDNEVSGSTNYGQTIRESGESGTSSDDHSQTYESDFPQASFQQGDYTSQGVESNSRTSTESDSTVNTTHGGVDRMSQNSTGNENWNDGTSDINDMINHYITDVKGHTNNMDVLNAVEKWRELIVNINEMIVKELADLFIMLYN